MYRKFKINTTELKNITEGNDSDKYDYDNQENIVKSFWNNFDYKRKLSADDISKEWFPQIKANVFLSHSHKDEKIAINFANYLYNNFKLISFIDSEIWHYMNELLLNIDDVYCKSSTGKTYDYEKRNISTSHVHTILTMALAQMIDSTECIIFLNSENTTTIKENIAETNSPWIYSELMINNIIRRRNLKRPRLNSMKESQIRTDSVDSNPPLEVDYNINNFLDNFMTIDKSVLDNWVKDYNEQPSPTNPPAMALDILYNKV